MPLNKLSPIRDRSRSRVSKPLALALMTWTGLSPRQALMAETEGSPKACLRSPRWDPPRESSPLEPEKPHAA